MAYSTNPVTLQATERLLGLQFLKEGRACAWTTEKGEAPYAAYRLREAMYIARLYPHDFPELAKAAGRFSIHVVSDSRVEAHPKAVGKTEAAALADARMEIPEERASPIQGTETFGKPVGLVGFTTALEVIGAWRQHEPSSDTLYFKQTRLPYDELVSLYQWCKNRPRKLMFFVGQDNLTLAPEEPEAKPFSWRPANTAPPVEHLDIPENLVPSPEEPSQ